MNAASAGPVASIIFPVGLYDTCVFSFKSDLLVLWHQSQSVGVCASEERGAAYVPSENVSDRWQETRSSVTNSSHNWIW